jgi:hypothetical protein
MHTKFWSVNLKDRDNFEDTGAEERIVWILDKDDGQMWIGLIWLRIGTSGGHL